MKKENIISSKGTTCANAVVGKFGRKVAMISMACWLLASTQSIAQEQSDSVRTLSEVVVTATKFAKAQHETGKVLAIIDSQQLERSAGNDLAQLLNEQVGLTITGANSNPGKEKFIFLRGASSDYTLILVDGIPMNDPSGLGGSFDLRLLPIDQIERIEILKGSQSTLYGSDAIAGVINILTKRFDSAQRSVKGFGTLGYGSYNTFKGNVGVAGTTELLNYNLSFTRFQSDGISEANDEEGGNNFDKDGFHQNAFQLTVETNPWKAITLRPFIRYTDFDGKYDAGSFADDTTAVFKSQSLNYGIQGEYALSRGAVHVMYARTNSDREFRDGFGTYPYHGSFDHAEAFVNHDVGKYLQLLAGGGFQKSHMDDPNAVKRDPSFTITSPYASFFVKNIKGFSAEVGGRYNKHSVFGDAFTYSINPSYMIRQRVKLFMNYSTGFKSPTLNELYGQFGANEDLKPQTSASVDGGVQFIYATFDVRATAFSRKIEDVISYGAVGYVNLDKRDDHGVELEATFRVAEKLTMRGYYAYVDGEVTTKTYAERDTTYHNLLRVPKHSFGVNAGYQVTPALFVSINLKTVGERKDSFFDMNDFTTKSVTMDAYQLLDVYVEYKLLQNRLKIFVNAKNVLNQKYAEVYGYSTLPFNVMGGLSVTL